jgi:hypothetical protein
MRKYTGCAVHQTVSQRTFTAKARARSQIRPCDIYDEQSGTGTGFSASTSVFLCQ